jgi:hypothetical protein
MMGGIKENKIKIDSHKKIPSAWAPPQDLATSSSQ